MSTLGTVPGRTTWTETEGFWRSRTVARERQFEDWTVDGRPLRELVRARWAVPDPPSEATPLCQEPLWRQGAVSTLRRLLGDEPGDFEDGRVALLVCSVCGDLGCRALSVGVVLAEETAEWRDVGWQVDHEPFEAAEGGFDPPMRFCFDRPAYTALLRHLLTRFEALPAAQADR